MKLIFVVPLLYFILAILTLPHYGINWDEPLHFNRGQSYLHFFLSGKTNFLDLPPHPKLKGASDFMGREGESELYIKSKTSSLAENPAFRRSYFQSDVFNFEFFAKNDGGHPPANDILAAVFNYIFYQKLGILGDIEAYHLFEITVSALLILGVGIFVYYNFGFLTTFIAALSLAIYPLFFAESHFNIKDPVETSFFGLAVITFYFAFVRKKWKLLILSAILAGLALGTKFNALFLPFILIPWMIVYLYNRPEKLFKEKKLLISLITYPLIAFAIFFAFWPYLWPNPIENLLPVLQFYKEAGTTPTGELEGFKYFGFNIFPTFWIAITTPLPILFLSLIGVIFSVTRVKKNSLYLLLLLWFLIPILRVSIPGTTLHGGIRHIMEFIPAMAILSGIGAKAIYAEFKKEFFRRLILILLFLSFALVIWEVFRLHPNENVYFNRLVGGLPGAKEKNIPYWGYNYGNVYLQGVNWLNNNAEPNAKLGLAIVNMVNVPRIKLRPDIDFSNTHPSFSYMKGEYVMEMSHNWGANNWYSYDFYDKLLKPVYEVTIDGVSLLKIWKNDPKYLKKDLREEKELDIQNIKLDKGQFLTIDLGKEIFLIKLQIKHDSDGCQKQKGGYIRLSLDGQRWIQEPETIDYPQIPISWLGSDKNNFIFLFIEKEARFIFLDTEMNNSCTLKNPKVKVFGI